MAEALTLRDFEAKFRDLQRQLGRDAANSGCVQCTDCKGCTGCTFCKESERLVRCHYCVRCSGCMDCSQCKDSKTLIMSQHCVDCENCTQSAYLTKCAACTGCTYCFGCVGLSGKDFHILNEPYSRSEYFAVTKRLMKEMGL
jgi:hypothetical protein